MTASAAEVEAAQKAMHGHRPTRGMKVAMGETCECGYWTGSEPQGPIPAGASLLFNHVAKAVADAVVAAAQPRIAAETLREEANAVERARISGRRKIPCKELMAYLRARADRLEARS